MNAWKRANGIVWHQNGKTETDQTTFNWFSLELTMNDERHRRRRSLRYRCINTSRDEIIPRSFSHSHCTELRWSVDDVWMEVKSRQRERSKSDWKSEKRKLNGVFSRFLWLFIPWLYVWNDSQLCCQHSGIWCGWKSTENRRLHHKYFSCISETMLLCVVKFFDLQKRKNTRRREQNVAKRWRHQNISAFCALQCILSLRSLFDNRFLFIFSFG